MVLVDSVIIGNSAVVEVSGSSVEVDSSVVGGGPPEVGDSVEVDYSDVDGDSVVLGICVVAIIGAD